jgi:hypothetical protein
MALFKNVLDEVKLRIKETHPTQGFKPIIETYSEDAVMNTLENSQLL